MQALLAAVLAVLSAPSYVSKSSEVTDPRAIQAFLADPNTHAYNIHDPVGWRSFRKILQLGTKLPNGSCKYPLAVSTQGNYASFATEIAVNHVRCQSLVLEGNPASPIKNRAPPPVPAARTSKSQPNGQIRTLVQSQHP